MISYHTENINKEIEVMKKELDGLSEIEKIIEMRNLLEELISTF